MKTKSLFSLLLVFFLLLSSLFISLAASKATDYEALLKEKIETQLARGAQITMTVKRTSTSTTTTISGSITNVSSSTLSDLVINGMIIKNRGETGFNYSVMDIFEEEKITIETLAPAATINYSFTLEDISWEANQLHGVIFVQEISTEGKEVLQAIYVE